MAAVSGRPRALAVLRRYIALGDSISIDDYPRHQTGLSGLGAVSLFHHNADDFWPEFRGRDLLHAFGPVDLIDLTADGATTDDVLTHQLRRLAASPDACVVTVTAGGNDMLMNLRNPGPPARFVEGIIERLGRIVSTVAEKLPDSTILLGTVYDPSDGTNVLYGERLDREAEWLARVNEAVRSLAGDRVKLIDIHRHFLGHGITAPESERWYWSGLVFEPAAKGASEVRRLWLEALGI